MSRQADLPVVLGQPAGPESVFELADVVAIASEIEDEAGIEARIR
jgi:hypothetical protein